MKHTKRLAALCILLVMFQPVLALAQQETFTVTAEEYALLEKYQRLEEIQSIIDATYLWEYDEEALLEGAAQGMLGALGDDYTFYYTSDEMESETETLSGQYGGLGIEVFGNLNDLTITIRRVFYGSPAQQGGIRPGDKIIRLNDEDMTAYDLSKAVSIMRGEVGGEVKVTILRDTETFEVTLYRAIIETEILDYDILDDNIGYLRIHYFEGNALAQFEAAMEHFVEQGVQGLVIDLRDNPGGLVNLAVDLADVFLDDVMVMSTEDKYGRRISIYADEGAWEIPVAVLINGYSASAAEILAGALSENGVATLVGTKSFGKGIMQSVYTFSPDGAGMQLTTDYWLTPDGNNIHEVGIEPDIEVELAEDAIDENYAIIREKDNQLEAAVEALLTKAGQ